jgi:hypothetical protein
MGVDFVAVGRLVTNIHRSNFDCRSSSATLSYAAETTDDGAADTARLQRGSNAIAASQACKAETEGQQEAHHSHLGTRINEDDQVMMIGAILRTASDHDSKQLALGKVVRQPIERLRPTRFKHHLELVSPL